MAQSPNLMCVWFYSIIIGYYLRYALTLVSVVLAFLLYIALRAYIAERE